MGNIENDFKGIYNSGKTVKETTFLLGIPEWKGYELKQKLKINTDRWQKVGMPPVFSKNIREVIFGTLLGDASLCLAGNCKYRKLQICHCPKQKDYLIWFCDKLKEIKISKITETRDKWGTLSIYTPPHPEFNSIYKICYPSGIKQITHEWLKELTPLSIAIWFMDDGGSQYFYKIATCSFSMKSCTMIKNHFKSKWGIETKISNNDYPRLSFDKNNTNKLKELIKPYIIPAMQYKLELKKKICKKKSKGRCRRHAIITRKNK